MGKFSPMASSLFSLHSYDVRNSIEEKAREAAEIAVSNGGASPVDDEGNIDETFAMQSIRQDAEDISEILDAFRTGKLAGESITVKDLMSTKDYPKLFYAATEILMMQAIQPARVVTQNLFQTIPYSGNGESVTLRTLGGIEVEEVPEGSPFPETGSAVSDQAFRVNLEIRKFGAKIPATRELLETDNWGIFGYTVANLALALMNKKERNAIEMLNELAGWVLMDNADPDNSQLGSATGRAIDGKQNGTMTIDDIMKMLAWMQMRGYNVDTLVMHPFAWATWIRDTEIREVIIGGGVTYTPQGNAAPGWGDSPFGALGQPYGKFGSTTSGASSPTALSDFNTPDTIFGKLGIAPYAYPNLTPFGATYFTQPKHVDRPLKIVVSPLVPYYQVNSVTGADNDIHDANGKYASNIIFADSTKGGLILQKENPVMEEWKDMDREIQWVKIRERYGMALQDQGRGFGVAKNVIIDRNYNFDNVNSQTLAVLSSSKTYM